MVFHILKIWREFFFVAMVAIFVNFQIPGENWILPYNNNLIVLITNYFLFKENLYSIYPQIGSLTTSCEE
jgi:hypothetical protein